MNVTGFLDALAGRHLLILIGEPRFRPALHTILVLVLLRLIWSGLV
ncbi:hypothetical protein [Oceaniovalibus sp. ACAM 378]|nr:hypothetical protein [Oceaniovalibus sp. ACAM 378]